MSYRKLLLAGAALAASTAAVVSPANASIIDRPHFKVLGVVIVWAADESTGNTPIATDFVIDDVSGAGDTDLIGGTAADGRTVVTGSLTATADATSTAGLGSVLDIDNAGGNIATIDTDSPSSFSSFDVTGASLTGDALTYESSFYVASNTAFAIDGVATQTTQSGDFDITDVGYSMDVTVAGTDGGLSLAETHKIQTAPSRASHIWALLTDRSPYSLAPTELQRHQVRLSISLSALTRHTRSELAVPMTCRKAPAKSKPTLFIRSSFLKETEFQIFDVQHAQLLIELGVLALSHFPAWPIVATHGRYESHHAQRHHYFAPGMDHLGLYGPLQPHDPLDCRRRRTGARNMGWLSQHHCRCVAFNNSPSAVWMEQDHSQMASPENTNSNAHLFI